MLARIWPLLLLLVSGAHAQQAPDLRVQSNVVLVPTLVKDTQGHVVYGLTQGDFVIEDDGIEQSVHLDESAGVRASLGGSGRSDWAKGVAGIFQNARHGPDADSCVRSTPIPSSLG